MRRESERDARIRRAITTAATASAVVLLAGAALTNTTTTNDPTGANTQLMYAALGEAGATRNDGMTSASAYAALGEAGGAVRHPNSAAERARQRRDARRAERAKVKEEEEAKKKDAKKKTKGGFFGRRRGRNDGGDSSSTAVEESEAWTTSIQSVTKNPREYSVSARAADAAGRELNRMENFAYDEHGEVVGGVVRANWVMDRLNKRLLAALKKERDSAGLGSSDKKHHNHKKSEDAEDSSAELGKKALELSTPVYIMTLGDVKTQTPDPVIGMTDSDSVEHLIKQLVRYHGTAAVKKYVRLTPGVNVNDWPKHEDTAQYALKSIMKEKPPSTKLSALPWLSFYTSRDSHGHFNDKFARERNLYGHVGCLFGHLFQYQLAHDAGDEHAWMLESDAWDPSVLGLPFIDMQNLVEEAPEDYDIIFTDNPKDGYFEKAVGSFTDVHGDKIAIYPFNGKNTQGGLSMALVSKRFHKKMFKHLAHFGGDVVDAMLKVQLCTDSMVDSHGTFTGFGAGNKPWLKCYWALPEKNAEHKHGKVFYRTRQY